MGQSVPSTSLLMTQDWKERLIHQRVMLQTRETLTGWRNRLTGTSWSSTRRSAKSCTFWGGTTSFTDIWWGLIVWKAVLQKRTLGFWWTPSWTWASNVPFWRRRWTISWAALGGLLPAGWGTWTCPCAQDWWYSVEFWAPQHKRDMEYRRDSNKGLQRWLRKQTISTKRKGWERWDCLA